MNSVRISTGLSWLPPVQKTLQPIVQALPLQSAQAGSGGSIVHSSAFTRSAYFQGQEIVDDKFPELQVSPQLRFAGRFSMPFLQNCDASNKTLDVVYGVYTAGLPNFNSLVFEGKPQPVTGAVPENATTSFLRRFQIQPQFGYNAARKTYGGTALGARFNGPVVQSASAQVYGSSQSLVVAAELSGSHDNLQSVLAHSDWKVQYLHNDVPLAQDSTSLNVLRGQFMFGTAPIAASELIFRFGGAVEGGNEQSTLPSSQIAVTDLANSTYGAVKAFVGSSFRVGRSTFKQSYGVKFGGSGAQLDFAKQLFDVEQSLHFYPASHRELSIDTTATFGRIDTLGQIPVSERFFGGNVEQNFTGDDSWIIRDNPFMRNFAENQFVFRAPAGTIAGNRFFSANATAAFNIWRYPLIPKEVEDDPEFRPKIITILSASEAALTAEYIAETDQFQNLAQQLPALTELMSKARAQLDKLKLDSSISEALDAANGAAGHVDKALATAVQDNKENDLSLADIQNLSGMEPDNPGDPPDFSYLLDFASALDDLKSAVSDSGDVSAATDIGTLAQQVRDSESKLFADYVAAMHSPAAKQAGDRAKADMIYSRRVVNGVFDTANLVAVSPVVMFDAGQIWQSGQGGTGVRYGLGTGVKLTLFAVDFTAGYSWNIHRRPGEGGGAFVLNFAIGDLFK